VKTLQIKVKPNARASILVAPASGNMWSARLKSPPVDGKANQELIQLVAEYFDCPKNRVTIKSGAGGRLKQVTVDMHAPGPLRSTHHEPL